jgi:hypothetical protein
LTFLTFETLVDIENYDCIIVYVVGHFNLSSVKGFQTGNSNWISSRRYQPAII